MEDESCLSIANGRRPDPPTEPGCQPDHDHFQRDFLIAFGVVLVSAIVLTVVNLIISHCMKNAVDHSIAEKFVLAPSEFNPEQVERTQYLVSLIGFPILCFIGWLLSNRIASRGDRVRPILYPVVASFVTIGLGLWLYFALRQTNFFYTRGFSFLTVILYLCILAVIYVEKKYSPKRLGTALDIAAIGLCSFLLFTIVFYCISTENDPQSYSWHASAYMYSIAQVFGGKTLLIDLTNQYGFYAYFLEPIFKIVGLHVILLTALLGVLLAGFFAISFFLIKRLVKSRAIALCAFLAIPGAWLWAQCFTEYGPVFQHWPHRVLFPGILLLTVWFYQKAKGKSRRLLYYSTFVICGMAILWNIDTGVVVFGSWIVFLFWETLGQWRSLPFKKTAKAITQHSLTALTVVVLSIGCLYIYTYLRSAAFPDMLAAFRYQGIFYRSGFSMLPMPLIHPWNLIVLTYCVGICISFSRLAKRMVGVNPAEDEPQKSRFNMIFIVSIMGAGLFSYYQGRSADASLLDSFWSVFFLLALFADGLLEHLAPGIKRSSPIVCRASNIATGLLFVLSSLMLFCYAGGIAQLSPRFADRIKTEIQAVGQSHNGGASIYAQNIDFIREYYSPGDQVLILGWSQATYYMESGTTNPLDIPGFLELVYRSDYQRLSDYLMNVVAVDEEEHVVPLRVIMMDDFRSLYPDLFEMVISNYHQIDRVNDLALLERN
jgi:hypothetical protein